MSIRGTGILRLLGLTAVLASVVLITITALAWGPTILYIAAPYYIAGVVLLGVRLWARSVDGEPDSLHGRERDWSEYWDQVEGRPRGRRR